VYDAAVRKHTAVLAVLVLFMLSAGCKTEYNGTIQNGTSQDILVSCWSTTGDCGLFGKEFAPGFRNTSTSLSPGETAVFDPPRGVSGYDDRPWVNCVAVSLDGQDWTTVESGDHVLVATVDDLGKLSLIESPEAREERVVNWTLLLLGGGAVAQVGYLAYGVRKRRREALATRETAACGRGHPAV
jgi:hypothetical protein